MSKVIVLIVDDELLNRRLLNEYIGTLVGDLSKFGIEELSINTVNSGEQAEKFLEEFSKSDCGKTEAKLIVIMDQNMGGQTGSETIQKNKKLDLNIIWIGCSAGGESELRKAGVDVFITKPFSAKQIKGTILNVFESFKPKVNFDESLPPRGGFDEADPKLDSNKGTKNPKRGTKRSKKKSPCPSPSFIHRSRRLRGLGEKYPQTLFPPLGKSYKPPDARQPIPVPGAPTFSKL